MRLSDETIDLISDDLKRVSRRIGVRTALDASMNVRSDQDIALRLVNTPYSEFAIAAFKRMTRRIEKRKQLDGQ